MGNGYRRITRDASQPNIKVEIDCEACNNQCEIKNDKKTIHSLRYLNNVLYLLGVCTLSEWIKYRH